MPYDSQNKPVIGIDLGTTFSSISFWTGQEFKRILQEEAICFNQ